MDTGKLLGRSIAFPPRIGADGRMAWSEGAQNIRESIQVILQTELGERLMLRSFGAGLGTFLFEPNTTVNRCLIQERIEHALNLWEPRIRLQDVQVDADPNHPHQVIITLDYGLVSTGGNERLALTLHLGG
ncbi:MAG: phage tail protein [Leptolyngbya sp. DLM2.Bin15]|nr:MAG: phage tail protein [Leptolyngbya sp. DLM2.Bin15]